MRERKHVITSCPTLIYCSELKLAEQVFTPAHHHQAAPFLLSAYEQVDGEKNNLKSGDHKLVCVCVCVCVCMVSPIEQWPVSPEGAPPSLSPAEGPMTLGCPHRPAGR